MGFRAKKYWVCIIASLLFICVAVSCAGGATKNKEMTLSSGMDIIADNGGGQSTNNNYDREFREQTRSSQTYEQGDALEAGMSFSYQRGLQDNLSTISTSLYRFASDQPNGSSKSSDDTSIVNRSLADSGMAETIESWFLPKAYAADHQLDERYLIRDGECSLQADSYKDAAGQVEGIAKLYNGMIADSHSQKLHDESVEGWIKLRIPSENFFDAWRDVREIGEVQEESVSTQDVSQKYVGYVSRLKNLMAEQEVLTEMLDEALAVQRARGLGEGYSILLDTQERLFKVTGEIESTEDRLGALADQITRSTITVRITEIKKLPEQIKQTFSWGFGETAGGAFKSLQFKLRDMAQGLIYFLITCWTWLVPWAIFIWIGRWIYKKFVAQRLKGLNWNQAVSVPKVDAKPKGE